MSADSLVLFSISTGLSAAVAVFDHYLASNPQLHANSTLQFFERMLRGADQAVKAEPVGIVENIIAGAAEVGVKVAEEELGTSGKAGGA